MSRADDFWSRRKAAVEAEEAARDEQAAAEEVALTRTELEALPDEEILQRLALPDPESLAMGDDFSVFMSAMVPDRLRRRALRHLWRSNPAFAVIDGLDDYNDDYTDAATVIEGMKTSYQVGKGLLRHVEAMAEKAEAIAGEAADGPVAQSDAPPEDSLEPAENEGESEPAVDTVDSRDVFPGALDSHELCAETDAQSAQSAVDDPQTAALPGRRRMKFHFLD